MKVTTREKLRITAQEEGWEFSLDGEFTDRFERDDGKEAVVVYYLQGGGIATAFHWIPTRPRTGIFPHHRVIALHSTDRGKKTTVRNWLTGSN